MSHTSRLIALATCVLCLLLMGPSNAATKDHPLICSIDDSQDDFKVYPDQLSYSSEGFLHYQLIDGLTVLVVNLNTMRFNRLSSLNLLAHSTMDPNLPAEPVQFFSGECAVFVADNSQE